MYNHLCLSLVTAISLAQLLKTEDELCGPAMEEWRTRSALMSLAFLSNSYMTLLPLGISRRCHHMWFMADPCCMSVLLLRPCGQAAEAGAVRAF